MDINNPTFLAKVMQERVLLPMVIDISKNIVKLVQEEMDKASISTDTMQKYTIYQLQKQANGYMSTVWVRDDLMQQEAEVGTYGVFNKFMSLDMSTTYGGKSIAWNLVSWLEDKGAKGGLGNNPIIPIGMFEKTYQKIDNQIDGWVGRFANKYGITLVRG